MNGNKGHLLGVRHGKGRGPAPETQHVGAMAPWSWLADARLLKGLSPGLTGRYRHGQAQMLSAHGVRSELEKAGIRDWRSLPARGRRPRNVTYRRPQFGPTRLL